MQTYCLKLFSDDRRGADEIEFAADDFSIALWVAQKRALDRYAELWCDRQLLYTFEAATGVAPASEIIIVDPLQHKLKQHASSQDGNAGTRKCRPKLHLHSYNRNGQSDPSAC